MRKAQKRYLTRLAGLLLTAALLLPLLAAPAGAEAKVEPERLANLVVFVKLKGDAGDDFNAVYQSGAVTLRNWEKIRAMYDGAANSFSQYIRTISEGRLEVDNYFPQAYAGWDGRERVRTLELSQASYSSDAALAAEVVRALGNGTIPLSGIPKGARLDHREEGFLDNLTIVLQGKDFNGRQRSYQADYAGEETFSVNGTALRAGAYNAIYSAMLVSSDGNYHVGAEQGVIAHEFLHTLGWPDLYRVNGTGTPVGAWDVMASTSSFLQYPLSWLRAKEGWIEGEEITQSGTYTLTAVSASGEGTRLFTIRTPMPEADAETICLEYRVKDPDVNGLEHRIPSSGLLMYRVNDSVPDRTNGAGKNYIYVYRPGATDPEAGEDMIPETRMDLSYRAALDPSKGQTAYGSTDLSAPFTENTLYYSTGRNSGVRISNARLSADGNSITFRVDFAEEYGGWQLLGGALDAAGLMEPSLCTDPETGALCAAYLIRSGCGYAVAAERWDPARACWTRLGDAIPVGNSFSAAPCAAVCRGELYVAYVDGSGLPVWRSFDGKAWSAPTVLSRAAWPQSLQLIPDGEELYAVYAEELNGTYAKRLVIQDVKTGKVLTNERTAGGSGFAMFSNPVAVKLDGRFYVLTSQFPSGKARIDAYDPQTGRWATVHEYSGVTSSNIHALRAEGGKLYAFAGASWRAAVFSVWDGERWTDTPAPGLTHCLSASIEAAGGTVYLACLDTTGGRNVGRLLAWNGAGLDDCGADLGGGLSCLATGSGGGNLYVGTMVMGSDALWVRSGFLTE